MQQKFVNYGNNLDMMKVNKIVFAVLQFKARKKHPFDGCS